MTEWDKVNGNQKINDPKQPNAQRRCHDLAEWRCCRSGSRLAYGALSTHRPPHVSNFLRRRSERPQGVSTFDGRLARARSSSRTTYFVMAVLYLTWAISARQARTSVIMTVIVRSVYLSGRFCWGGDCLSSEKTYLIATKRVKIFLQDPRIALQFILKR